MMEWLKAIYGALGAQYPLASLIAVAVLGGFLSGAIWWLVGKEYSRSQPAPSVETKPRLPMPPVPASPVPATPAQSPTAHKPATASPFAWDFESATTPGALYRALFNWGSGGAGFWITFFRITGRNQSAEPLLGVKAYVQPQIYKNRIPLQFELKPNELVDTAGYAIEPGASFVLSAKVPSPTNPHGWGYNAKEYMSNMGGFTFVFEAGSTHYSQDFSYARVKEAVELAESDHGPKPAPPAVRKLTE